MSDLNSTHNRFVWMDIPVADLERAAAFYAAVLGVAVHVQEVPGAPRFGVIDHDVGNGGCLVVAPEQVAVHVGVLVYLNVDGRMRDAVAQVEARGGKVLTAPHSIGPHGFRAVILDSEGNRVALHSQKDG